MRKERGGEVTWCSYAEAEVSAAQGRAQRCVFCLVPPLNCQEPLSFMSETFAYGL